MKLNISLNDELASRIDTYADANYLTRSGLISIAVTQYLNQHEAIAALKGVALSVRKIADNNTVSAEDLEQIKDFERLAEMLTKQA